MITLTVLILAVCILFARVMFTNSSFTFHYRVLNSTSSFTYDTSLYQHTSNSCLLYFQMNNWDVSSLTSRTQTCGEKGCSYPDDKICLPLDANACDVTTITESGLGRKSSTPALSWSLKFFKLSDKCCQLQEGKRSTCVISL